LKSEQWVEDRTGLRRVPGSGCGLVYKGDNGNRLWHYEDKSTRADYLCIKLAWLDKAKTQANSKQKPYYALGVSGKTRIIVLPEPFLLAVGWKAAPGFDFITAVQHKSLTKHHLYMCTALDTLKEKEYIPLGFFNKTTGITNKYGIVSEEVFAALVRIAEQLNHD